MPTTNAANPKVYCYNTRMSHTPRKTSTRLPIALLLSALFHLIILSLYVDVSHSKEIQPLEVELLAPQPKHPKEQIVSPSQSTPTKLRVDTPLRAEQNSKVEKQQIRRGLDGGQPAPMAKSVTPSPAVPPQPKQQPKSQPKQEAKVDKKPVSKAQEEPEPRKRKPKTAKLRLSQDTLAKRLAGIPIATNDQPKEKTRQDQAPKKNDAEREAEVRQYRPFRYAKRSQRPGQPGVPDHLPTIQDGEVTLLNTKADKYAVFVRRVALQVFGALRQYNWSGLSARDIRRIQQFATVHAILSPDGSLKKVYLGGSSGAQDFDSVVVRAARSGAWDQNPPKGAQTPDGTIHFIFQARTWSRVRGDGAGEQRWLLLATGLR